MKSVYIHIPFCKTICSYCDFCKVYYNETRVDSYLDALEKEIKESYKLESLKTIYVGGGTPSCLNLKQLENLLKILSIFNKELNYEFTFECNIDIEEEKIKLLSKYGINRISVGIETVNHNYLKLLNRSHNKDEIISKINLIKKYFTNINVDLMYGFKDQTIEELNQDIDFILNLDVPHISTYSLIIEPHTVLAINNYNNVSDDLESDMYYNIIQKFKNYIHYETSNFSKVSFESNHNLTYWNNEPYYGFGLGASGYISDIRYDNTRSLSNYLNGKMKLNENKIDFIERLENEFILGLRKIKGINKKYFKNKYGLNITSIKVVSELIKEGKLIDDGINIYINHDYLYIANSILVRFIGEIDEVRCVQ